MHRNFIFHLELILDLGCYTMGKIIIFSASYQTRKQRCAILFVRDKAKKKEKENRVRVKSLYFKVDRVANQLKGERNFRGLSCNGNLQRASLIYCQTWSHVLWPYFLASNRNNSLFDLYHHRNPKNSILLCWNLDNFFKNESMLFYLINLLIATLT